MGRRAIPNSDATPGIQTARASLARRGLSAPETAQILHIRRTTVTREIQAVGHLWQAPAWRLDPRALVSGQ